MSDVKENDLLKILQEISEKQDTILQYISNIDQNYKIILQRSSVDKTTQLPSPVVESAVLAPSIVEKVTKPTPALTRFTVQQNIQYLNGDPVILADVRIHNSDKKEIKKTKTGPRGQWAAILDGGSYFIQVSKPAVESKPVVDLFFPIMVEGSTNPLLLEVKKV